VCQRWNSSDPHHHILSTEDYPELAGGHNFCRNPGGKKKKPWCFTTDADTKFDFCDVPSCGKLSVFLPALGYGEILRLFVERKAMLHEAIFLIPQQLATQFCQNRPIRAHLSLAEDFRHLVCYCTRCKLRKKCDTPSAT